MKVSDGGFVMDEQTSERIHVMEERISTVETEVAVIQSNYVKRDEFAGAGNEISALRAEMAENFRGVEQRFGEVQRQFGEVRVEIKELGNSMLRWMVATHLAFFIAIVTVVHYVR